STSCTLTLCRGALSREFIVEIIDGDHLGIASVGSRISEASKMPTLCCRLACGFPPSQTCFVRKRNHRCDQDNPLHCSHRGQHWCHETGHRLSYNGDGLSLKLCCRITGDFNVSVEVRGRIFSRQIWRG